MAVPDAALLSDSEGSMNQDVARQHLAEQIYRLKLWDKGEVSAATKSLLLSIERPPYSIQADTVCCYSVSRRHSQSSSHDDYASSDGGDSQTSSSGQQLHYPSYAHMDPGRVRLVLPASLAQLEDIIRSCQVAFGTDYKQVLLEAFSANSHALSRFFYEPDIPWILRGRTRTFMDPCERTEALTSMLKINTQVLCLMQQQLCEQSRSFEELKVGYFAQFAKCPIKEVLEIAVCLSEAVWPATHIRPMLLACEALKDVFPLLEKLPSSESGDCLSNISHNMREAFRRLIDHTKHHIESNMKKHQDDIAIHPMTCFLICSVRSFCSHRNLVQSTLAPGDNPNNSFGHLLHDMITCWKSGLSEHANIYRADVQRQCIFVLNNRYHFNRKTDGLLDQLLSDGQIVEQHDVEFKILYDGLIKKYTEEACSPAKSCLNRSWWWGSQRPSLVAFTSKFNETFDRQRTWEVADVALRQALKDSIENCILPDYTRCLKNCSSSGLFCSCLPIDSAMDIYSTESLQKTVQSLFEGC